MHQMNIMKRINNDQLKDNVLKFDEMNITPQVVLMGGLIYTKCQIMKRHGPPNSALSLGPTIRFQIYSGPAYIV